MSKTRFGLTFSSNKNSDDSRHSPKSTSIEVWTIWTIMSIKSRKSNWTIRTIWTSTHKQTQIHTQNTSSSFLLEECKMYIPRAYYLDQLNTTQFKP